jgi:hypothetical protein
MTRLRCLIPLAAISLIVGVAACGSGSQASGSAAMSEPSEPSLSACPKDVPELAGGSSGAKGGVVTRAPESAVLCRWRVEKNGRLARAERVVHGRALAPLKAAFNSLPPGQEGEFECESGLNLWYLIGFRFADGSGNKVEVDYSACGAVRTGRRFWGIDRELGELLDGLIDR